MSPLLRRLGALGVDDRGTRARFASSRLADRDIERLVDTLQRAVPIPQLKIEMRRALRRQIFRQSLPFSVRISIYFSRQQEARSDSDLTKSLKSFAA
jgi:hypothetical protein